MLIWKMAEVFLFANQRQRQVEYGTDIATLQELLGHSKIEITKRYSHSSKDHKADARMESVRLEWEQQREGKDA